MNQPSTARVPEGYTELAGLDALAAIQAHAGAPGDGVEAIGYLVFSDGEVPTALGLDRATLAAAGFDASPGSTLVVTPGQHPQLIAVGAGPSEEVTVAALRDRAASFVRAAARFGDVALVTGPISVDAEDAAAALAEGAALARYRFTGLKADAKHTPLRTLQVEIDGADEAAVSRGLARGLRDSRATVVAREVTNMPPGLLTATVLARISAELGERFGFDVEIFDKAALTELGCGGLLGVNQGSAEEPRMVKLRHRPSGEARGHLGLIGKGIMYDSGGISLKPSDPMHLLMKMDMGGAAAVLGAFSVFAETDVQTEVTGWLMCTDNMPSGTAFKLGDVLVARNGTTVEVKNTDAEGRLVMMDAIALANEDGVDAMIDIATLTGAALMALGQSRAPLFANNDAMATLVEGAAEATGEAVWRFPLERSYRSQLDSDIADISNLGGKYAGATTAALFLEHFVGKTPWAHLDIAGTMQTDKDDSWRSAGATGFGARLLATVAAGFSTPA